MRRDRNLQTFLLRMKMRAYVTLFALPIFTPSVTPTLQVVVRNAGHMTPAFAPRASFEMFQRFLEGVCVCVCVCVRDAIHYDQSTDSNAQPRDLTLVETPCSLDT